MFVGPVVLLSGLALWLLEEISHFAPAQVPRESLPFGGGDTLQVVASTIAIGGFPLCGLSVHPADESAARTLLLTWVGLCLVLGATFTATTATILQYQEGWASTGAEPRTSRVLLHICNAFFACGFAWRFSCGLSLPPARALPFAWDTGHAAGATICIVWIGNHILRWHRPPLTHFVPSLAILAYMALTTRSGSTVRVLVSRALARWHDLRQTVAVGRRTHAATAVSVSSVCAVCDDLLATAVLKPCDLGVCPECLRAISALGWTCPECHERVSHWVGIMHCDLDEKEV